MGRETPANVSFKDAGEKTEGLGTMTKIAHSAKDMISGMTPVLRQGQFVFATAKEEALASQLAPNAIATMREAEGLSLILPLEKADASGLEISPPMRCIMLNVYSSLEGVGLTAAVSAALGENNIPCNMVAGYHHDHVFVPEDLAVQAMHVLTALQGE